MWTKPHQQRPTVDRPSLRPQAGVGDSKITRWSACHSPAAELFAPRAEEISLEDVDVLLLCCSQVKESFPGDVVATLSDSVVGLFSMVAVELSPSKIVVVEVLPSSSAE